MRRYPEWEEILKENLCCAEQDWKICCYHQISSTMDLARQLLTERQTVDPLLVLSKSQTMGRGRRGNTWEESAGALYLTVAFPVPSENQGISGFSLVVGCVLYDFFSSKGCRVGLKWPNDVLSLDRRKLAGILVESASIKDKPYLLTGIGINLVGTPNLPKVVSMFELCSKKYSPLEAASSICPELYCLFQRFCSSGFKTFKESWLSYALCKGEEVSVNELNGVARGVFRGISDSGMLLLEQSGEITEISSGEVVLTI